MISKALIIRCDGTGCSTSVTVEHGPESPITEAREWLVGRGWFFSKQRNGGCLCPECQERVTETLARERAHAAALADQRDVLAGRRSVGA